MDLTQVSVGSIMSRRVVSVSDGSTIRVAARLLLKNEIAGLPVVDSDNRLLGVISEKELLVLAAGCDREQPITYCHNPSIAHMDAAIKDVLVEMVKANRKWLPVVDEEQRIHGVIARRDILRALMEND